MDDENVILKYAIELEYVNVWVCRFLLEKCGSAIYSGGKKIQLSLFTP